jgi:hypothetical protein
VRGARGLAKTLLRREIVGVHLRFGTVIAILPSRSTSHFAERPLI